MGNFFGFQGGDTKSDTYNSTNNNRNTGRGLFSSVLGQLGQAVKDITESTPSSTNMTNIPTAELCNRGLECLNNGHGEKAILFFKEGAFRLDVSCMLQLYDVYYNGKGVPADLTHAWFWARMSGDYGSAKGDYLTGLCYRDGKGVDRNELKAWAYFERAMRRGYIDAKQCFDELTAPHIKHIYPDPDDVYDDLGQMSNCYDPYQKERTEILFKMACWDKETYGKNALGVNYMYGKGVEKDPIAAYYWLQKAVECGDKYAHWNLANMYANNFGVLIDYAEVVKQYEIASGMGHEWASQKVETYRQRINTSPRDLFLLTEEWNVVYRHEDCEDPDDSTDAIYHCMCIALCIYAAQRGGIDACLELGKAYELSRGVKRDMNEVLFYHGKVIFLCKCAHNLSAAFLSYALISYYYAVGRGLPENMALSNHYFKITQQLCADTRGCADILQLARGIFESKDDALDIDSALLEGNLCAIDVKNAIARLDSRARQNDEYAILRLIQLYLDDLYVPRNAQKALEYIQLYESWKEHLFYTNPIMLEVYPAAMVHFLINMYNDLFVDEHHELTYAMLDDLCHRAYMYNDKALAQICYQTATEMYPDQAKGYWERFERNLQNLAKEREELKQKIAERKAKERELQNPNENTPHAAKTVAVPETQNAQQIAQEQELSPEEALAMGKSAYAKYNYTETYNYCMKAAVSGNAEAQYMVGKCYFEGAGVPKSVSEAFRYLEMAESAGNIDAAVYLGDLYYSGSGISQDKEKAFMYYKKAAESNHPEGCFKYAEMFERGFATERNLITADEWLQKAYELGHPYALAYRHYIREWNRKNPDSSIKALYEQEIPGVPLTQMATFAEYLENEYRYNQAYACYEIANFVPWGTPQMGMARMASRCECEGGSFEKAMKIYEGIVDQSVDVYYNMGKLYETGNGVLQDYNKALECYEKSTNTSKYVFDRRENVKELLNGTAWNDMPDEAATKQELYKTAEMLYKKQRMQAALVWYEKAAEKENSAAMAQLGYMYLEGEGCVRDYEKAFYYLQRAADEGCKYGLINLGLMYGYGLYVEKNVEKAIEYMSKSIYDSRFLQIDALKEWDNECQARKAAETISAKAEAPQEEDTEGQKIIQPVFMGESAIDIGEYPFYFESPISSDDMIDPRILEERAKAGDSGAAICLGHYYMKGDFVDRDVDEALYWFYKIVNSTTALEDNVFYVARLLGLWYTIGVNVTVDYQRAKGFFEKMVSLGHEEAKSLVDQVKEVISMQYKPESYMYLDSSEIIELITKLADQDKAILLLFYARELIRRGVAAGYFFYGACFIGENPLGYNDSELSRACFSKARELGDENCEMAIAETYYPTEGFLGDPAQLRRWLELAIELNREGAREAFEELQAYYESVNALEDWNSDEPLKEIVFPDWLLLGVESRGETDKAKERELPDDIEHYFEGFIGMQHVKEQIRKIYQAVKLQQRRDEILRQRGEEPIANEKGYNFILLGNPGTGKTSIARIIARILYDINIRESDTLIEVERSKLIGEHIGSTETRMRSVLDKVKGGTLFVDEAYALYKEDSDNDFGREAIDVLMKDMEDNRNSYSVIMAGYKQPMLNMIKNANSGFSSRFSYQIEIPDYTEEELIEMAHVQIEKLKYQLGDKVDDAIRKCIRHDKIDDTFGNARYIRELVNRAIENQATRLNENGVTSDDDLFLLTAEDFWTEDTEDTSVEKYLDELNSLIGLDSVKEDVKSLVSQITVMTEMEKRGLGLAGDFGTLHMAFKGNPGTGKTTVARIIGKLYASLGVLKRGDVFVECSRAELVGKFQGHTAANVKKVVESAMGGILFVDEAYSLVQGDGDSFGREAVDTLVAEMENNRKNLVVIFAGYSKDIDEFFKNNQGLKSRVPKELYFEDYNLNELYEIALSMIKAKNLTLAEGADEALRSSLVANSMKEDFGNARGVRNIIDGICRKQNVRIAQLLKEGGTNIADAELLEIKSEDI